MKEVLEWLAAWVATTGCFWVLFDRAERVATVEGRKKVVDLFTMTRRLTLEAIPSRFASLFDMVFGYNHVTVNCFIRSCIASLLAFSITALIAYSLRPGDMKLPMVAGYWWTLPIALATFNVIPDYISLLQTRWFLKLMANTRSSLKLFSLLALDALATFFIFVTFGFTLTILTALAIYAVQPRFDWTSFGSEFPLLLSLYPAGIMALLKDGFTLHVAVGIPLWTTFFTSLWLWLYAGSVVLARSWRRIAPNVGRLQPYLQLDQQPLRTIGFASTIIITICFIAGGMVALLF